MSPTLYISAPAPLFFSSITSYSCVRGFNNGLNFPHPTLQSTWFCNPDRYTWYREIALLYCRDICSSLTFSGSVWAIPSRVHRVNRVHGPAAILIIQMAFSMKSAMRSTVVVAAMAMLAIVESQGLVSAARASGDFAPAPAPEKESYASALLPSIAVPAIFSVLSYVALKHL